MDGTQSNRPRRRAPGIETRHARDCAKHDGRRCNCQPTYRAWVYSKRDRDREGRGKKIRKSFPTLAAAKAWRADAFGEVRRGSLRAPKQTTLRQAAAALVEGMRSGTVTTRGGRSYKPSTIRAYDDSLRIHVQDDLGAVRLADITRADLQDLIDRRRAEGVSATAIHGAITPLQVIFRRAIQRGELAVNPTTDLERPSVTGRRDRAATSEEAAQLLDALPARYRALYATAFYAGLRRGELQALRWDDVDLAGGVIRVERSWDPKEGVIAPKSEKGERTVPIVGVLRDYLTEHRQATGRSEGYVFGSKPSHPFTPSNVRKRAAAAWEAANVKRAEDGLPPLVPIRLHECRHTYVSLMHDAGFTLERIGDYCGHTSTYMTDAYRHLLDGHEAEAAQRFGDYLARSDTRSRLAQVAE